MTLRHLAEYLEASAERWPRRTAAVGPGDSAITYEELARHADLLAGFLIARGVRRGDRVGVVLPKSLQSVTALFGIMKAGAAYVPVDCTAPPDRIRTILTDCRIRALVIDSRLAQVARLLDDPPLAAIVLVGAGGQDGLPHATPWQAALESGGSAERPPRSLADLAYILYTSGSTGVPKGVMLTHRNASSFVEWCSEVFAPTEQDRFSSHAPFHFDLSVLDIYLSIKHGATLHLISEEIGRNPRELARFIAANRLTVWYSTPSILTLLLQYGHLEDHDASSLRLVLFAGEVFPVKHLRELQRRWPRPAYYNLYGPTETNVCTYARLPPRIPDDRELPFPIGVPCAHCRTLVLDAEGREVPEGHEGLLHVAGPSVFQGYWNRPAENAAAFLLRGGECWYNTGDVVRWDPVDGFIFVGRKDRMVKRRGYRIELGEIEQALYKHPRVREAAVVSIPDAESGVQIIAFVAADDGCTPSIVELKTFCARHLPAFMSPDRFVPCHRLPKTSTDKIDYQALRRELLEGVSVGC